MDNTEQKALTVDRDAQIQVVVQNPDWQDDSIDLGRVFLNMKRGKRVYAWVLVLCVMIGLCVPLLIYQFTKEPLTVSSLVTLNYSVPYVEPEETETTGGTTRNTSRTGSKGLGEATDRVPVTDLTAPDGTPLDLNQVTSSYVLQNALNGIELSKPITLKNLRDNIRVERILTEESRQQQEVVSRMVRDKNANAYTQAQNLELKYENRFIVSLTNGFGEEDSRVKYMLKDNEIHQVLDRILSAYNEYLVKTYSKLVLPKDEISVIDFESLDFLDSLDLLRTAADNLYRYCDEQTEEIRAYRSWKTGRSLNDWMETLETIQEGRLDYLYSFVYEVSFAKDYGRIVTDYQYKLRNAEAQKDIVSQNIATTQKILDNYENDEIFVTIQESDNTRAIRTTTVYYNELMLQQVKNYKELVVWEEKIANLKDKVASINEKTATMKEYPAEIEKIDKELNEVVDSIYTVYVGINNHMKEILISPVSTTYAERTAAQGKTPNFLVASAKMMAIGVAAGIVIACGLWFLNALAPEFLGKSYTKEKEKIRKEAEKV